MVRMRRWCSKTLFADRGALSRCSRNKSLTEQPMAKLMDSAFDPVPQYIFTDVDPFGA